MAETGIALALAGSPGGEQNPFAGILLMGIIFAIFYFAVATLFTAAFATIRTSGYRSLIA